MIYYLDPERVGFPDPEEADKGELEPDMAGLLAVGGGLSVEWLVEAYCCGIFPWYGEDSPIMWWSLDPRMVMEVGDFRYSKSLQRVVKSGRFEVRVDTCFEEVIRRCAEVKRVGQNGTWIVEEMIEAYIRLHGCGLAHSFETFMDGRLVGGLYGVSIGDWFSGESMFHTERDASKVAFVRLVEFCKMHNFRFIDAQQPTPHLGSLGARPMERKRFLEMLEGSYDKAIAGCWMQHTAVLSLGTNMGDREEQMRCAEYMIERMIGPIALRSGNYVSEPWGFEEKVEDFLNKVIVVDTDRSVEELLDLVEYVEKQMGREKGGRPKVDEEGRRVYCSRPMDVDILLYDSRVIDTERLKVPHERMAERRFVMEPLAEVLPEVVHPVLKKSMRVLLEECEDGSAVRRIGE